MAIIKRPFSCPFCDGSASLWQRSATQAWLLQECDKHHNCVLVSSTRLFLLFILSHPPGHTAICITHIFNYSMFFSCQKIRRILSVQSKYVLWPLNSSLLTRKMWLLTATIDILLFLAQISPSFFYYHLECSTLYIALADRTFTFFFLTSFTHYTSSGVGYIKVNSFPES